MPTKNSLIEIDWGSVRKALATYIKCAPEFRKRFAQIPAQHEKLKATILSQVKTWECYTFSNWDLDPSYFLLDGHLRPGRRMKTDPGPDAKVLRYGFDADRRIVMERRPSNSQESFWEYHADRIDGVAVHTGTAPGSDYFRINVQSLFLENGQPACYFQHASGGVHLRLFRYDDGRIVQVLSAHGNDQSSTDPNEGWVYEFSDIAYDAKGDAHVRRFHQSGDGYAHIYKMPKRTMAKAKIPVLDLREDVADTVSAIKNAVKKFSGAQIKSGGAVSGIGLGFFPFENPEIFIRFDTRPVFEPDGEWTHPEFARLKRARWGKFVESCEDAGGKGAVIDANGDRYEIAEIESEERFVGWLGEALVAALKTSRNAGVFKPLKKAARCELGVEEAADGAFGWPRYENRGKENLV
jgi:hypothetical protein